MNYLILAINSPRKATNHMKNASTSFVFRSAEPVLNNGKNSDIRLDSPSSPSHRSLDKVKGRRGSVLGVESLALLQEKLREAAQDQDHTGSIGAL